MAFFTLWRPRVDLLNQDQLRGGVRDDAATGFAGTGNQIGRVTCCQRGPVRPIPSGARFFPGAGQTRRRPVAAERLLTQNGQGAE